MKYKKVYSIEVLNDYFPNGQGGLYRFLATEACASLMRQTGALYKSWGNMLYVYVKTDANGKPLVPLPLNAVFEFYIEPADSAFFQYTLSAINGPSRYLFHNAAPLVLGGRNYLYGSAPNFDGTKAYSLNDLVTGGGNNVFEAVKNLAAGSSLNDVQAWANRGQVAYPTGQCLIPCYGAFAMLPVSPSSKSVYVEVFKVYPNNILPKVPIRGETVFFSSAVTYHNVNCEGFTAGLYEIRVNNVPNVVWIDPAKTWQYFPAITAVGNYGHLSPGLALVGAGGQLLSPEYTIRFAPRLVLWQLKYRGNQPPANGDSNGNPQAITFTRPGPQPNVFLTAQPVRMQQLAYKNGILLLNNNDPPDQVKVNNLPAPPNTGFEIFTQQDTDYFLTTTNLYS